MTWLTSQACTSSSLSFSRLLYTNLWASTCNFGASRHMATCYQSIVDLPYNVHLLQLQKACSDSCDHIMPVHLFAEVHHDVAYEVDVAQPHQDHCDLCLPCKHMISGNMVILEDIDEP